MNIPYLIHGGIRKLLLSRIYDRVARHSEPISEYVVDPVTFRYYQLWFAFTQTSHQLSIGGRTIEFVDPFREMGKYLSDLATTERPVLEDFDQEIQGSDVVFDIGADIGLYTCLSASRGLSTVAFEPLPDRRGKLRANLVQNDCVDHVSVLPYALVYNNELSDWAKREFPAVKVANGDDLIDRGIVPQPTVLKIDIEGGEFDALRGLQSALTDSRCRLIYSELHPALEGREKVGLQDDELDRLKTFLRDASFEVSHLHTRSEHNDQPFLKAVK